MARSLREIIGIKLADTLPTQKTSHEGLNRKNVWIAIVSQSSSGWRPNLIRISCTFTFIYSFECVCTFNHIVDRDELK